MAKNLNLPTTVGVFCDFLDGESVEPYGNMGTTVIDILHRTVPLAIERTLTKIPDIRPDEFQFLRTTFIFVHPFLLSEVASVLAPIDLDVADVVLAACGGWVCGFAGHLPKSSNEASGVLSNSQVLSSVKSILQDCDEGKAPTQIEEFRLNQISRELFLCMHRYLKDQKDIELDETSRSLAGLHIHGNSQESLDGDFPWEEWQNAWNQPFQGQALAALETKLQLNAQAIRTDETKFEMSRIIPVVQGSGTGKSRLAEEYGPFPCCFNDL
jgi:hypothetical protein